MILWAVLYINLSSITSIIYVKKIDLLEKKNSDLDIIIKNK